MALYAFDGTWNLDNPGTEHDTNVTWFHEAYTGPKHYFKGIGTRFGALGHIVGGITGAGGRDRVKEAMDAFAADQRADKVIDVVGFSRGSALAMEFANKVCDTGASVRFLGLWDCVPSFGVAAIPINIGWDLDLPDNVQKCFHALALDERRIDFKLHRLEARVADAKQDGRLFEIWFRGVHSDVGGGNDCPGLSSIALNWMFAHANALAVPLNPAVIQQNAQRMNPLANISHHGFGLVEGRDRTVRWNDIVHSSVSFRPSDAMTHYNNPPANLVVVDDAGRQTGNFQIGAAAKVI
jgi:pimeloyl-ACP methyl ester carboxylesterase